MQHLTCRNNLEKPLPSRALGRFENSGVQVVMWSVGIGLTDLPKSGGGGGGVAPPEPPAPTALLRMDEKGLSSRPPQ